MHFRQSSGLCKLRSLPPGAGAWCLLLLRFAHRYFNTPTLAEIQIGTTMLIVLPDPAPGASYGGQPGICSSRFHVKSKTRIRSTGRCLKLDSVNSGHNAKSRCMKRGPLRLSRATKLPISDEIMSSLGAAQVSMRSSVNQSRFRSEVTTPLFPYHFHFLPISESPAYIFKHRKPT